MRIPRLVISVSGGLVDDVLTDAPDLEVILIDADIDGSDGQCQQIVEFEFSGRRHRAFVGHLATGDLPDGPDSWIGTALRAAGYERASRPSRELSDRELATVLAALRFWQTDLAEADEIVRSLEHFQEHEPLGVTEIDELCQRLNYGDVVQVSTCECEQPGYFHSGVPGILAHVQDGRLAEGAGVERCDQCQRFAMDADALAELVRRGIAPST